MTVVSDIGSQTTRMQRASAPAVQQAAPDSSSSAAVQQTLRITGLNGAAGGSQDEASAACVGPTVSSVHDHRPSASYARVVTSARCSEGCAQTVVRPQPQLPLGDFKPLMNDHAVPVVAAPTSAARGDGATQVAGGIGCDTTGRPPSAQVPPQRTLPVAGEGSSATGRSPAAAEQLIESLDCDCKGVPNERECNGKCGETYPGSGFVRWVSGKRHCVDQGGQPLPQMVSKLHRMVRQLQADHSQQQERMRSQLQAAEQNATSLGSAKHDADSALREAKTSLEQLKQQFQTSQKRLIEQHQKFRCQALLERKEAETSMEKLKQQYQASQKKLIEQHQKFRCQAEAEAEELKRQHTIAQEELAPASSSSSAGPGSGGEGVQAQQGPLTAQRCAGGSFPVGFGSVEQRECLDQLSVATEQLAAVLVQGNNLQYLVVQHLLEAAKGSLEGTAALVSSWERDSCAAALTHHVLNTALDIAQQQEDWYQHTAGALLTNYLACLTSCPESGRTELHGAMQQLQQAKSSTLFLVAQQQAPSHPVTREAVGYVEGIRQYMQGQLEQQLGLYWDKEACRFLWPQLVAVAAAMTRVNLLLASLQCSCPGLQLVSKLEEWGVQERQETCEAPVRQLFGKVNASRPLFLVRPGLVCAAAGGGRQVLVRQQAVQLVPDPAWLEQQRLEAEAARKQQEERERLEAEMKHRRKQEAQRLLEEERLAKEEQQQKQQEEKKGRLAQACKDEQMQQEASMHQRPEWLEAAPSFLGACAQDLSTGGHACCPGPDTQAIRLDSSAQGSDGQCSDADSQAGCDQSHESVVAPHHQSSAPDQGQLVATAISLAAGQAKGGQRDANALNQQLEAVGAMVVPAHEKSWLLGGAASTSRSAAQQHGARQDEGLETAATQPPPCSLTESGAMQQPPPHPP